MAEVLHPRGGPRDAALLLLRPALRPRQPRLRSAGLPQRRPPPARRRLPRPPAPGPRDRHLGAVGGPAAHRLHRPHLADRRRHGAGDERRLGHPARRGRRPRVGSDPLRAGVGAPRLARRQPRSTTSWRWTSRGPAWCRSPGREASRSVRRARPCRSPGSRPARPSPSPTRRWSTPSRPPAPSTWVTSADSATGHRPALGGRRLRLSDEPGRVVTATEHTDLLVWTFALTTRCPVRR